MNCKTVHNKLVFFVEKELPVSEMKQVQEHLESCSECALFAEEMQLTFGILENEKVTDDNPFFYTRVKARIENEAEGQTAGRPVLARVLQPVAFSILLVIGIYSGIKIGQPSHDKFEIASMINQGEIPFLNEMKSESIEAFLME